MKFIIREIYKSFHCGIDLTSYNPDFVIAMNETAVYYDENLQTSINAKWASSSYVPPTDYDSARVTCVFVITRSRKKLIPLIISKTRRLAFKS